MNACRVCGSKGPFDQHYVHEMNFGTQESFLYLECLSCQSLQISTIPPDLSRHYPPEYLCYNHSANPTSHNTFRQRLLDYALRQRTAHLVSGWTPIGWAASKRYRDHCAPQMVALRPIKLRKDDKILDVGCGPGILLHRLSLNGYKNLSGQDPFQGSTVPGINVYRGNLENLSQKFDLIMLHHSLEHVPNPVQLLIDLKPLSAPGGLLLVRVPLAASEAWTEYNVNWYQIDAPRHLVIPSRDGVNILAERAGYKIIRVRYDSDETQFLCSEQYCRGIPLRHCQSYYNNPSQTTFSRSEITAAKDRSRKANRRETGDQACFYLRATF